MRDHQDSHTRPVANIETVLAGLRATGESTRLRIVALLGEGELTVSELCRILGQTQPRVSRHLKLLCDSGLLDRHAEGTSAFFGPTKARSGRAIFETVASMLDETDPTIAADRDRLASIRAERTSAANRYFEQIATDWDDIRSLHVDDQEVETAIVKLFSEHRIDGQPVDSLLDIGTGTGRMLEICGDRVAHGLGIDLSTGMLNLARSNLTAKGLHHCSVRHGNIYTLDVATGSYDLAVLHHVLHFLDDPARAIASASAALGEGGLLVVVDFAPHQLETLRSEHAHRRLGFADHELAQWFSDAGLGRTTVQHLVPQNQPEPQSSDHAGRELLTVGLWTATQLDDSATSFNPSAVDQAS